MNAFAVPMIALIAAVALAAPSAFALEQAYPGTSEEGREKAMMAILEEIPISVETDKMSYDHNSMIMIKGSVANMITGIPVTLTVTNPMNSVVTIDQIEVDNEGKFATSLSTAGMLWKYDGTYTIKVNYGSSEKYNKVLVELVGGMDYVRSDPVPSEDGCSASEIAVDGYCIPYKISGGTIVGASLNPDDMSEGGSITIQIDASEDGYVKLYPPKDVIDGVFLVLVNGEESDDVFYEDDMVKIMFLAGMQEIELIATFVVPEFGTIALLVLAAAIISIVAVTSRSKIGIMPRLRT